MNLSLVDDFYYIGHTSVPIKIPHRQQNTHTHTHGRSHMPPTYHIFGLLNSYVFERIDMLLFLFVISIFRISFELFAVHSRFISLEIQTNVLVPALWNRKKHIQYSIFFTFVVAGVFFFLFVGVVDDEPLFCMINTNRRIEFVYVFIYLFNIWFSVVCVSVCMRVVFLRNYAWQSTSLQSQ